MNNQTLSICFVVRQKGKAHGYSGLICGTQEGWVRLIPHPRQDIGNDTRVSTSRHVPLFCPWSLLVLSSSPRVPSQVWFCLLFSFPVNFLLSCRPFSLPKESVWCLSKSSVSLSKGLLHSSHCFSARLHPTQHRTASALTPQLQSCPLKLVSTLSWASLLE